VKLITLEIGSRSGRTGRLCAYGPTWHVALRTALDKFFEIFVSKFSA
jgi:hypothetical protein